MTQTPQSTHFDRYASLVNNREDKIDEVGQVAQRLKETSIHIGQELDTHALIIDEVNEKTPLVNSNIQSANARLKRLILRDDDKKMWAIICCLCCILLLVIFLAIIL
ncbi:syntaxin, putative [Entamoeba invadens IP1]|uniref:Syntaxin, putative n=1 Tax=Entamoeba invadens IP1 TaxID=370355 RepID=A0A0A1U066_ENTIV|nr:syntaxin, putative [Entamoeba invadens IP1]ELP87277.1 syntaxin, putative [Entamoeba invadens IP1]|eukprot:XP_004254048.1 syntaxin, putative [Entamoeba invadens IP1]